MSIAKEIWVAIRETNSKVKDAALIYHLNIKTRSIKQENKSVTKYSNMLRSWWQELNQYRNLTMDRSKNAAHLKQFADKDCTYHFLARLN